MYMALLQQYPRLDHCEFVEIEEDAIDTSELHAHVVPANIKAALLHDQQPGPSSLTSLRPLEANALMGDLNRLAPSAAKDFISKQQAQDCLVLRLINDGYLGPIRDEHNTEDSYIALSYCWKKPQRELKEVETGSVGDLPFGWIRTVEKFPLPTSRAMFQAVLEERIDEKEGLWYDQVCVNQEDDTEKAIATGAMDLIYKNARAVVIALDDIAIPHDEASFLRCYVEQYASSNLPAHQYPDQGLNPPFMQRFPLFKSLFERLLSSIWFERAWCIQEMRVAQSHIFLVPCVADEDGDEYGSCNFVRFSGAFFLHMLLLAGELDHYQQPVARSTLSHSLSKFFCGWAMQDYRSSLSPHETSENLRGVKEVLSFLQTVQEILRLKASGNPRLPEYLRRLDANRDRTSIALNVTGLPLVLKPPNPLQRPFTEDECLRYLLLAGIASRDPECLCTTGPPLQLHDGSISWLCRPSPRIDAPDSHPLPKFDSKGSLTQSSDGRAEYVQLDLVFLDLPQRTRPNPNFSSHIQRARTFITLCIQHNIPGSSTWSSWQTPGHPRGPSMQNIFIQTLACCFECGPDWVFDISTSVQYLSPNPATALSHQDLSTLLSPALTLQPYISHQSTQQTLTPFLDLLSTLINHGVPWSSGATERTHGPMIVNSPAASSAPYASPQSPLTSASMGRSIIYAPFEHSKTLLIAVPEVLKNEKYGGLARGWILTPTSTFTGGGVGSSQLSSGIGGHVRRFGSGGGSGSGSVSWTLQGKGVLFGEKGFRGGVAGVDGSVVRNHRVFGPANKR